MFLAGSTMPRGFLMSWEKYMTVSLRKFASTAGAITPEGAAPAAGAGNSALFVSGQRATTIYRVLSPEIDVEYLRRNQLKIEEVCNAKSKSVDLSGLISNLENYEELKKTINNLTQAMQNNTAEIKRLSGDQKEENSKKRKSLEENNRTMRSRIAAVKKEVWRWEETAVIEALNLPNFEEENPPPRESRLISSQGAAPKTEFPPLSHRELIPRNNLGEFSDTSHTAFYLRGQLAELELCVGDHVQQLLLHSHFHQVSNPDFTKSVVVEGCGRDFLDPEASFSLHPTQDFGSPDSCQAMHLVGGASLPPFVAYFSRHLLLNPGTSLPINIFTIGRKYSPVSSQNSNNLLETQQSTGVELFSLSGSEAQQNLQLDTIISTMERVYSPVGHFKVVEVSMDRLENCEARKFSFEVWLPSVNEYVSTASVSVHRDYFSRRMMMKQQVGEKCYAPLWCVSAEVNISRLLANLIENSQTAVGTIQFDRLFNAFQYLQ